MVKGKGAALFALALAGAAYIFKNKQQVRQTIDDITQRAGGGFRGQGQPRGRERGVGQDERPADWSQGNIG